jgi:hypothetical protein
MVLHCVCELITSYTLWKLSHNIVAWESTLVASYNVVAWLLSGDKQLSNKDTE